MSTGDNNKTPQGSPSQGTPIRDEIAVMLRRIMDRVLPEPAEGDRSAPKLVRYGVTFLGTLFWFATAVLFILMAKPASSTQGSSEETKNSTEGASDVLANANLSGFITESPDLTAILGFIVCSMFACLIATTFKHGRPLTFFFCGLIYPSLAVSIVKYAFLS